MMTTPLHNTPACPGHGSPATHHPCLEARLTQLRAENEELRRTREHLRDFIRVLIEQRDHYRDTWKQYDESLQDHDVRRCAECSR